MPVFRLTDDIIFPRTTLAENNGLLAVGGDLSPARLIMAYRMGIFPWYSEGDPVLWWFISPRMVLYPNEFKVSKRLARYMRNQAFRVSFDTAFNQVISLCAGVRTDKGKETWITEEMKSAYSLLHRLGYAHSVECWHNNELAGGLYGIALDRIFFGESMFTRISNASQIAFTALISYLKKRHFGLIDCQMATDHLAKFGAREISGPQFRRHLQELIQKNTPDGTWKYDI